LKKGILRLGSGGNTTRRKKKEKQRKEKILVETKEGGELHFLLNRSQLPHSTLSETPVLCCFRGLCYFSGLQRRGRSKKRIQVSYTGLETRIVYRLKMEGGK